MSDKPTLRSRLFQRTSSFSLVVKGAPSLETSTRAEIFLINHDLKPVPPAERTWGWKNYVNFWVADSINISTFQVASTGISNGLSWWQTWIAVWLAYVLAACILVLNARISAVHHINFPVVTRSSFGVFGSLWPVFNRIVLACVWFSYQTWIGGECMTLVFQSWAPNYLNNVKGTIAGNTALSSFVAYFVFWLVQFPVLFITPQKVKTLFTAKAIVMPLAAFALLGWTVGKAGGLGQVTSQPSKLSGSELGWAFVLVVMNQLANMVTLVTNSGDWGRLASKRSDVVLPQLITIPVVFSVTSLIGILISSSSEVLFGTTTWNPLTVMTDLLALNPEDSGTRAGVFFISASFILAQIGTNVAANSLSAGTDLTSLLPRYISIKRGQIICGFIALVACPWFFATSSSSFATYLSAYSVLLAPILGVLLSDCWLLRRGHLDVPSLFSADPLTSTAYYTKGFNWRAFAAYLIGCALNMPGFVNAVSDHAVPEGLVRVYELAFFTGSLSSALCYLIFSTVVSRPKGENVYSLSHRGFHETKPEDEVDYDGRPFNTISYPVPSDEQRDVESSSEDDLKGSDEKQQDVSLSSL